MTATQHKLAKNNDIQFVVENVRLLGYAGFWIVVAVGYTLTSLYSGIDMDHTLLTEVFGYNNICVYFDFPPANYVLPLLWAITLVFLLGYMVAHWLQMLAEAQKGLLGWKMYRLLSGLKLFEAFTMVAFSTIFAVSPTGHDHTLYIHTIPFFLLQIGMVSLAMSNTLHGIKSGYWKRLGLPTWFETGAKVYVVIFAIVVAFKIPAALNAMAGSPWWIQTDNFKTVAYIFDKMFLICAAIIPMAKAGYMVVAKRDQLEVIHVQTRMT